MEKLSKSWLIVPHVIQIILAIFCINYFLFSEICFYVMIKSVVYGPMAKYNIINGTKVPDPDVSYWLNNYLQYQYSNYIVILLYILICFGIYVILKEGDKIYSKKIYIGISSICIFAVVLSNMIIIT